jgi:hypothetical protein
MKPTVRIFKDLAQLSRAAAEMFVTLAAQAIHERGRFLVALSGGSTPTALYRLLARVPIDWTRVQVMDRRGKYCSSTSPFHRRIFTASLRNWNLTWLQWTTPAS